MPHDLDLDDALILGLQPVRDADLIVTLLAPYRGRVEVYARSARKSARRYGGQLELFLRGQARLKRGRGGLPQLVGFDRSVHLAPSGGSWPLLCIASSVAELAVTASQPEHADAALYAWTCGALGACQDLPESRLRLASLVIDLGFLQVLGTLPEFTVCCECAGSTASGATWTVPSEGWRCLACSAPQTVVLSPRAVAAVAVLLGDAQAVHDVFLSRQAGRALRQQVDKLLAEVLPVHLRSRASLREALAGLDG